MPRRVRSRSHALVSLVVYTPVLAVACAASAGAVTFDLLYDDVDDQTIGTATIVGTGTFSYDGPATVGSFPLSSLSGFAFNAIILGVPFTTADILSNPATTGISVFSLGAGQFGLVFTGAGGTFNSGSLDLENGPGDVLSHEPTSAINNPIGCCGGNGTTNLYYMNLSGNDPHPPTVVGDYSATAIPEPGTLALSAVGLLGLAASRRN